MADKLRWGIVGAGGIAGAFATGLQVSQTGVLTAVGSRSLEKARQFAARYAPAARCFGEYHDLLRSDACDAVYIATPHPMHAEWAIEAAICKKHILCEKPIGVNTGDTQAIVAAAKREGVFLMEAFMYRCHPLLDQLRRRLADGVIGEPRFVQASFSFKSARKLDGRLYHPGLAGGGILDVGGYPVSFARLVAGARSGSWFEDPISVAGAGAVPADSGVDEWAAATLKFRGNLVAEVFCGVQLQVPPGATIHGTEGRIEFPQTWMVSRDGGPASFHIIQSNGDREEVSASLVKGEAALYACEADVVARALPGVEAEPMTWADTLGNMRTLEQWRKAIGVVYPMEKPEGLRGPVHGKAIESPADPPIVAGSLPGIEIPVSRLVLGSIGYTGLPHLAAMFDAFYERGGNTFDTSWHYGNGKMDGMIGAWLRSRGVRDQVVLIGKGAHTPWCQPEFFRNQLEESLEKLGTDHLEVYMLHRDNRDVPVGEWVDALEEQRQAGRFRLYGGSNWTRERIDAANEYARRAGAAGFRVLSNQFSLARMVDPVWAGCLSVSGGEERRWLEANGMILMPWSSQARGFFTERSGPEKKEDEELVRCWYSDDNFERKRRCYQLAAEWGVSPVTVAASYVLHQPFATFPLIGPFSPWEMDDSIAACSRVLSPEQLAWLDLQG